MKIEKRSTLHIQHIWIRRQCWMIDTVRSSRLAWEAFAVYLLARYYLARKSLELKLSLLAAAYRRTSTDMLRIRIERLLSPWMRPSRAHIWRTKRIGWTRYGRDITGRVLQKSLILKAPGHGGEKGVLYLSFELNWLRLLQHFDYSSLLAEYFLVGASSSSPPDFPPHWAFAHIDRDPFFIQISHRSDVALHSRLNHNLYPLPLMASDWINPDFYSPKPHNKREIDILMVAGWSRVKRHWALFRALREMPQHLRVVLIGQDMDGRTAADVFAEAKAFGVARRIEIVRDAPITLVTEYQCNSKASVILSRREGSCVVVAESLFADTPVAMLNDAHVGSRVYINGQTGVLVRPESLHLELSKLVEDSALFRPREWALAHITCFQSTQRLNQLLRDYSVEHGLPWYQDIRALCWHPDPEYADSVDNLSMAPAYEHLYNGYGILIAKHFPAVGASLQRMR